MATIVVGRLAAILEAQTAIFEARMDAAAKVSDRFTRTQVVATRAVVQVRTGLQGLANQAFATAGPVGQLASGLTQLVGGATALAGAAAGGAMFLWLTHVTKQIEQATAKADEFGASFRRMAAARIGSPLLTMLAEREPLDEEAAAIQAKINKSIGRLMVPGLTPDVVKGIIGADPELSGLQRQLDNVNRQIDEIGRKPETVLLGMRREVLLLNAPLEETLRLQAEWAGLVGKTADEFVRLGTAIAMHPIQEIGADVQAQINTMLQGSAARGVAAFAPPFRLDQLQSLVSGITRSVETLRQGGAMGGTTVGVQGRVVDVRSSIIQELTEQETKRQAILGLLNDQTFMANLAAQGLTEEFNAMVRAMNRTEIKSQQLAVAIVTSVAGAIQAIIGGGGPSSFISGAGGVVSALATKHPALLIPGIVLTAFGGILGAFERQHSERERNEERRKNDLIAAIHEGPVRITNEFVGDPARSTYEDRRFDRLGGESRLGGL